jgi:hypothetical protein
VIVGAVFAVDLLSAVISRRISAWTRALLSMLMCVMV